LDDPLHERVRLALAPEFELDGRVAAGGMGIVYRARDVALDRVVAVKVLRPELATATARERFLREARLLARLQHPNIVPVHRADERDGLPFYVMDFFEGHTLADRLQSGPLPPDELTRVSRGLLEALAAAHAAGIVHRDVKPQNIFLRQGRAVLGDFGIAREAVGSDSELTEDGLLLGTREYMSPEQLRGEPATERSDQYSAAAVLYNAASGKEWKALEDPARANWRGVPGWMVRPLRGALAADPARRWPSVAGLRRALERGQRRGRRAVALAILLATAVWFGRDAYDALVPPTPTRDHRDLAILPFTVVGGPADSLGLLVPQWIDINLNLFPSLTKVSFGRGAAWRDSNPQAEPEAALRALDVDRVVTGHLTLSAGRLTLHLALTDSAGTQVLPPMQTAAPTDPLETLGEVAAFRVGTSVGRTPGTDLPNLSSTNARAVGAFMEGEERFDEDSWHAAAAAYGRAVAADPSWALARWRQVVARLWSRQGSWEAVTALALCCAAQLPRMEAGLAHAMGDTDYRTRFTIFDTLQAQYGGDSEFLLLFGSDLFHRGPLVGRGLPISLEIFDEAIRIKQGLTPAPAYDHMVWGNVRLGRRNEARRWLAARKRLQTTDPDEANIPDFLQLGYDFRWVPWRARMKLWLLERFGSDADRRLLTRYFRFSSTFDIPNGLDAMGRMASSRLLNNADRASGHVGQGLARLTWGQPALGIAQMDSAAQLLGTKEAELQRHQWRLMLPVLGAGRATEQEARMARAWLTQAAASGSMAPRARFTLAVDAWAQGDDARAAGLVTGLQALSLHDSTAAPLAMLAMALQVGDTAPRAALAATEWLVGHDSPAPGNDIFMRSLVHLRRAAWFEEAGDKAAALGAMLWYENSDMYRFPVREAQKAEVDAVASVAARVTRARLLLETGEQALPCALLARARQLWRNADSSLAGARASLDSLRAEAC